MAMAMSMAMEMCRENSRGMSIPAGFLYFPAMPLNLSLFPRIPLLGFFISRNALVYLITREKNFLDHISTLIVARDHLRKNNYGWTLLMVCLYRSAQFIMQDPLIKNGDGWTISLLKIDLYSIVAQGPFRNNWRLIEPYSCPKSLLWLAFRGGWSKALGVLTRAQGEMTRSLGHLRAM